MVEKPDKKVKSGFESSVVVPLQESTAGFGGRTIQSAERALDVLEIVAQERDGVTVSEISERLDLNISTCHHLITTLVKKSFAIHLGRTKGYALGPRLTELVRISEGDYDPDVILSNDLKALGEKLGHSVEFAILTGTSLLTKLSFRGLDHELPEPDQVEKMTALHATATGKAILAWIPDTELVRIISANGLTSYRPKTITTLSGLVEELRLVRRRKYSIDDQEFSESAVCIGATIRAGAGAVIGAISVTIPVERSTTEYRDYLINEMIAAANSFSNKLREMKV